MREPRVSCEVAEIKQQAGRDRQTDKHLQKESRLSGTCLFSQWQYVTIASPAMKL